MIDQVRFSLIIRYLLIIILAFYIIIRKSINIFKFEEKVIKTSKAYFFFLFSKQNCFDECQFSI